MEMFYKATERLGYLLLRLLGLRFIPNLTS
jgi:hypothetical protein